MIDDHMEIGEGLIPQPNGWFLDKETGNRINSEGQVFNVMGEMIWDPSIDDLYEK